MDGDVFAGVPVRDLARAQQWYEAFLGDPASFFPHEHEAVWDLGQRRYLYVVVRGEHAGHALHTFFLDDLDGRLADVARRGLHPAEVEHYDNGVQKAVFRDPDGNELGLAGAGRSGTSATLRVPHLP